MNFPVMVHAAHGQYEATLVGAPEVRVTAPTRAEALAALETALAKRVEQGELVKLEVGRKGLAGLFGKYRDDPTLQDICDEAYKERDGELQRFSLPALSPDDPSLEPRVRKGRPKAPPYQASENDTAKE